MGLGFVGRFVVGFGLLWVTLHSADAQDRRELQVKVQTQSKAAAVPTAVSGDYFTEAFDGNAPVSAFAYTTTTFTPDRSGNFYVATSAAATDFPTDPYPGHRITLTKDSDLGCKLTGAKKVALYGVKYGQFFINSNGSVTFGSGDNSSNATLAQHFLLPRIAALFDDLEGGRITWQQLGNRVVVSYQGVSETNQDNENDFQIEMFFDGRIRITEQEIEATSAIVGLSAGNGVPTDFTASNFFSYMGISPIYLSLPVQVVESDGVLKSTGVVGIPKALAKRTVVTLTSLDPTQVTVPTTVVIPAGQTKAKFDVTVINNSLLDGTRSVGIQASTGTSSPQEGTITITDDDTGGLSVSLPASVTEGGGSGTGTVTETKTSTIDTTVSLSSSDSARVTVPATIVIPAGATSANFAVQAVDDDIINGTENVTVTAHVDNWTDGSAGLNVLDNETNDLKVTLPGSVSEDRGTISGASVSISGTRSTDLVVALSSSDPGSLTVPATVTIVAGKTLASFSMTTIDNAVADGDRSVTVTATAENFTTGQAAIPVLDNEMDHFSISSIPNQENVNSSFKVTITALNAAGNVVTGFTGTLALSASGGAMVSPATTGNFVAGVWTGRVTVSTLGSGVSITATGAGTSVQSNSFDVIGQDYNFPANWPAFGNGPAHTSYQPVTLGSASFVAGWSKSYPQATNGSLNPVAISNGVVAVTSSYNSGGAFLSALDASTGQEFWQRPWTSATALNAPTIGDGHIYVNNVVYGTVAATYTTSVQTMTGGIDWQTAKTGTALDALAPVLDGDQVWVGGSVYLLGLSTVEGSLSFAVGGPTAVSYWMPSYAGGVLYIWNGWTFQANDANTGVLLWSVLGTYGNLSGNCPPALADGKAFVASGSGLQAIDLTTHAVLWRAVGNYTCAPSVANGTVYVETPDYGVTAYDENTGTKVGFYPESAYTAYQPIVTNDSLIISDDTNTYIYDLASGTLRQTLNVGGHISLANGVLYIASTQGATVSTYAQATVSSITLTTPATVVEGTAQATGTVTVSSAVAANTTTKLVVSDPSQLLAPTTVVIPAGQTSADFHFSVPDDNVLNGERLDAITATADGYVKGGSTVVDILDNESATLQVNTPVTVVEGNTFQGTVSVYPAPESNIIVHLTSSDATELQVPGSVLIPAGQTIATFTGTAVNDDKINGLHSTVITAHVSNWTDGQATVNMVDNENRNLSMYFSASVVEGGTIAATVAISGKLSNDLVVNLVSSDPSRMSVPASVTIPAGSTSVDYTATATNNNLTDGMEVVSVTATASGFTQNVAYTTVYDDDVHHFEITSIGTQQVRGVPFTVRIYAESIDGNVINGYSGTPVLSASGSAGAVSITPTSAPGFSYGSWTGNITVNDFASNVVLTATDGSASAGSNAFNVGVGAFDHFGWGPISSPQAGVPFSTTLTAEDAGNNPLVSYQGTVAVSSLGASHTTGTGAYSVGSLFPSYYVSGRTQCIYLASEIGRAGTITSLAFYVPTKATSTFNRWTIRMKPTSLSSYTTYGWDASGWTTVYQASQTFNAVSGWVTINLTTPFAYDGTSNLMVDFSFYGTTSSTQMSVNGSSMTASRAINAELYSFQNSDPLTWSGTNPQIGLNNDIPNLQFRFGQPVPVLPASVNLTGGVWSGQITISQAATDIDLVATDTNGNADESDPFDVNGGSSSAAFFRVTTDTLYEVWKAKHGVKGGPGEDDDHDGKSNLEEYAFGTEPEVGDKTRLPQSGTEKDPADGKEYPTYSYHRRIDDLSLRYMVLISPDQSNWIPAGDTLEEVGTPLLDVDGTTEMVTVRLKTPVNAEQKTFFNLEVSFSATE